MTGFIAAMLRAWVAGMAVALAASASAAIAPQTIRDLAFGESDAKIAAIGTLTTGGDPQALPLLQALLDGQVQTVGEDQVLLVKGDTATDLLTGRRLSPLPANLDDIVVNNRVRRELDTAIATLKLVSRIGRHAWPRPPRCRTPPTRTRCH